MEDYNENYNENPYDSEWSQNGEHIPLIEWIDIASYLSERSIRLDQCLVWAGSVSFCREKHKSQFSVSDTNSI